MKGADARKAAMMPNRPGWAERDARPGDLIVAGTNFGCGSSRPAPRVLRDELGLSSVVAESFSRLFQRNAVNIGFPVLICPGISAFATEGDELEVHFDSGLVRNETQGTELYGEPYPPDSPPGQLLRMGGLRPFLEQWLEDHPEARARPDHSVSLGGTSCPSHLVALRSRGLPAAPLWSRSSVDSLGAIRDQGVSTATASCLCHCTSPLGLPAVTQNEDGSQHRARPGARPGRSRSFRALPTTAAAALLADAPTQNRLRLARGVTENRLVSAGGRTRSGDR